MDTILVEKNTPDDSIRKRSFTEVQKSIDSYTTSISTNSKKQKADIISETCYFNNLPINFKGLPMMRLVNAKYVPDADPCNSIGNLLRPEEFTIGFESPQKYGNCWYMNPSIRKTDNGVISKRLSIETSGCSPVPFGYCEDNKFNKGEYKKSSITIRIPTNSQTYHTLKLFEKQVLRELTDAVKSHFRSDVVFTYTSFLKQKNQEESFALLKVKIDRSRKDQEKVLCDVKELVKTSDSPPQFIVRDFERGLQGIEPGYEVRLLMEWSGMKLVETQFKTVHHMLSCKCIQVVRQCKKQSFISAYDPSLPAP